MPETKEKKVKYFSPKKGDYKTYKPSTKEPLKAACDIIAKTKADEVYIYPDRLCAYMRESTRVEVAIELGVTGIVKTKELKALAKCVHGPFSITVEEDSLKFTWGEGDYSSIDLLDDEQGYVDYNPGAIVETYEENCDDFAATLLMGGAGVAQSHSSVALVQVQCGQAVSSSDGILLCKAPFLKETPLKDFLYFSHDTYHVWCKIDLPLESFAMLERGVELYLEEGVTIGYQHKPAYCKPHFPTFEKAIDRVKSLAKGVSPIKLGKNVWKVMSKLKKSDSVIFSHEYISSPDGPKFKFPKLTLGDRVCHFDPVQLLRLKPLIGPESDLYFIQTDYPTHSESALYIDTEPGKDGAIILTGKGVKKEEETEDSE